MTTDPQPILNALSVDVEDYFQVSAFEHLVPRERWKTFDSRVAANTNRLLDAFDEAGVKATFFTLGWIAAHHPRLVRPARRHVAGVALRAELAAVSVLVAVGAGCAHVAEDERRVAGAVPRRVPGLLHY